MKKLQGDNITIVVIVLEAKKFIAKINKLHQRPVLGGWEDKFLKATMGKFEHIEVLQTLYNFMEPRLHILNS
jgi:hypothetical protein